MSVKLSHIDSSRRGLLRAGAFAIAIALPDVMLGQASFTPMGPPPPGHTSIDVQYVTNDGTVIGYFHGGGFFAYTWRAGAGFEYLPPLEPGGQSVPFFAEPSGYYIPGFAHEDLVAKPILWIDGQPIKLGEPPPQYHDGRVTGVSWDGTIAAGMFIYLFDSEAFVYRSGSGIQLLGFMPTGVGWTSTKQLPQFGDVILSTAHDGTVRTGVRWTEARGWESLGVPPGWLDSRIEACSRDGRVAAGRVTRSNGLPGIARWTEGTGWLDLGFGDASSVSGDGWTVMCTNGGAKAQFWNPIDGVQVLQDVLEQGYGIVLPGWKLSGSDLRISDNGRYNAGIAFNPQGIKEGFLVEMPPFCYADCDRSSGKGNLDVFDFLCFVNKFNAKEPYGNCDNDGKFDVFDFLCFVNQFNAGCGQ